jgi:hypothetical protein
MRRFSASPDNTCNARIRIDHFDDFSHVFAASPVLGNLTSIRARQQVCGPDSSLSPTHPHKKLKHNELDQERAGAF